jgi:MFS family permease
MASSSRANLYLYGARAVRGLGDGFAAIILPAYLSTLGFTSSEIGAVATAALLGSALLTLLIGFVAPHYGQRALLIACAGLMVATGAGLASTHYFPIVLLIAFIGTINPTIGDIGLHVPLEQIFVTAGVSDNKRTHVLARYSFIGALSIAAGALAAAMPDTFLFSGIDKRRALQIMFFVYGFLGVVTGLLYLKLPSSPATREPSPAPLGPSRVLVYKLAALFSLDAFASGFVAQFLLALWLFQKFGLSLGAASTFFFWSNLLSAFSYPIAASLGTKFGLVNTIVFTHLPAAVYLVVAAFTPDLTLVLILLLVRATLSQMDVPTRTSYVLAVVTPAERPAAASFTAVPRSLASAVSPAISGVLLATSFAGMPLVISGLLKSIYDLTLLFFFRQIRPPEEQASEPD